MTAAAAIAQPREFVLYPNQPLPTRGFVAIMAGVASVSFVLGVGFIWMGAWPVTGFLGLDVVGLYLAFRLARRHSRRVELIRIGADGLTVRRVAPDGRAVEERMEPYWTRVTLQPDGHDRARLMIGSHGRRAEIGHFLTFEEKTELARALEEALREHR